MVERLRLAQMLVRIQQFGNATSPYVVAPECSDSRFETLFIRRDSDLHLRVLCRLMLERDRLRFLPMRPLHWR